MEEENRAGKERAADKYGWALVPCGDEKNRGQRSCQRGKTEWRTLDRTSQQRWTGTARPEMLQKGRGAGRLRKDLWPEEVGCRLSSEGPLPGDQGAEGGGHRQ